MARERQLGVELDPETVKAYASTFIPRLDTFPIQLPNGGYVRIRKRLRLASVAAHLFGYVTLGAYALDKASQAKWLCFDADDEPHWLQILQLAADLEAQDVPVYLELSRRGGHLWLFTPQLSGHDIRRFGRQLLADHSIADVELFPKQDTLVTGPGSLVRLPLGIHRKSGRCYHFVKPDGMPIAPTICSQVEVLAHPRRVPRSFINDVLQREPPLNILFPTPQFEPVGEVPGAILSERIKSAISVYDFVGQYVRLDGRGRGLCPFHNDHHKSFGVNQEGNYWHCFAGCGGGSIIDFWMKWREKRGQDADFVATITELAGILL